MKKLAIITTHPIQYYAPVFALLNKRCNIAIKVFYTWGETSVNKYDPGFGKAVMWDVPLLEGYPYEWVNNIAEEPGSHHFNGIINPDLNERVKHFHPDAILVVGWSYQSHFKLMRYFKGKVSVYFRGDSTLTDEASGLRKMFRRIWLRWVYSFVDHAFFVGINNKAYLKEFGLKENQLTFAPHAVDNSRFAIDRHEEADALRLRLGLTNKVVLILFAGKFEQKKSPVLLLEVFLKLKRPDVHLLLTGNGQLEEKLKAMAAGAKNVHFMDFQNQSYIPVVYQACDLFCLPSAGPGETWGLSVNEAMACGKPVIVSDRVGCAVDLVQPGKNGGIFVSGDADDLLSKLGVFTEDKERLITLGKQSQLMIQKWDFLATAIAIENRLIDEEN